MSAYAVLYRGQAENLSFCDAKGVFLWQNM
nr:MAG TPA_asm: hypothetical protein [Caudoviricetes sp.]